MQFRVLRVADREAHLNGCLEVLDQLGGTTARQVRRLEQALRDAMVTADGVAELAEQKMHRDLEATSPTLSDGIAMALFERLGVDVDPGKIALDIELLPEVPALGAGVLVQHNLPELASVESFELDLALVYGLLAAGNLNLRIALMEQLGGISGCGPNELPLLDSKLRFLLTELDPNAQEERLLRAQVLAGIPEPDLSGKPAINADALLKARMLPETRAL